MPAESEGSVSPRQGAARDLDAAVDNPSSPSAMMSSPASAVASTTDEDHADRISDLVTSSLNHARNDLATFQFAQPGSGQDTTSMEPPKTPTKQVIPQRSAVPLIEEDTAFAYPSPVSQQTPSAQDVQDDEILRRRLNVYKNFGARNEFVDQHLQASPQTPEHFTRSTTLHTSFSIKKVSTIQCDECKAKGKGEEIYKCNHCVKQICRSCVESLLKRERLSQEKIREQELQGISDDEEDSEPFKWNWQGLYRHEGFKQCYIAREEANVKGDFHIDIPVSQLGLAGNQVVTVYMVHDQDHDEDNGPPNAKRSRSQIDPSSSSDEGTPSITQNGNKKPLKKRPRLGQSDESQSPAPTSTARTTGNEQQHQVTEPPVNRRLFQEYLNPDGSLRSGPAASREPSSAPAVPPVSAPLPASSAPVQPAQPALSAPVPQQGLPAAQYGPAPPGPARPQWVGPNLMLNGRVATQPASQPAPQPVPAPRRGSNGMYPLEINHAFLAPPVAPPNMELIYVQPRSYRTRRPSTRPQQSAPSSNARQPQPAQNVNARQQQPAQGPSVPQPRPAQGPYVPRQPAQNTNALRQQFAQVATAPQQQSAPLYAPPAHTVLSITDDSGQRRTIRWDDYQHERRALATAAAASRERRVPPPIDTRLAQTHGHLPQPDGRVHRSAPALGQDGRRQSEAGQDSAVLPGRRESQDGRESVAPPLRRQAGQEPTHTNLFSFPPPGEIVGRPMAMNVPTSGTRLDFNQAYHQAVLSSVGRWSQAPQPGRIIAPTQSTIVISDDDEPQDNQRRNFQRPGTTGDSMQPSQRTLGNGNIPSAAPSQAIRQENNVEPQPDRPVRGTESPLPVRSRPQPAQNNASLRAHLPNYYDDDETELEEAQQDGVPSPRRRTIADIQNRVAELLEANPAHFDHYDGTHPERAEDEIRVMIHDNNIRRNLRYSLAAIPEAQELGLPAGPLTDQDAAAGGHPPYRPGRILFAQNDPDGSVRAYSEEVLRAASILASIRDDEEGERIVQARPGAFAQHPDDENEADDDEVALPANEEEATQMPSSPPAAEEPEHDSLLAALLVTPRRTRSGIEYTGLGRSDMGRR